MTHLIAPSVNVFIIKDDKVLLGRRMNTGWMDGYLWPAGGHVEKGETPTIAIQREIEEELGVTVDPKDIEFVCVAARNNTPTEYVAYEFVIRDKDYTFTNAEPEKCSELVWVPLDDLPEDVADHAKQIIEQGIVGGQAYLELGYDSQTFTTV
jgi:ADP-ribose pyrophosphatase YjhB (NUDIX family)